MKITLHLEDSYILEKFRECMGSNHKMINDRGYIRFSVGNRKLYNDLIKAGCGERKSLTLTYPINVIPEELEHHFIRGFFDGDGYIGFRKNKLYNNTAWVFSFCSTHPFNESLRAIFCKKISDHICDLKIIQEKDHEKVCYFTVGGTKEDTLQKIYEYLYNGSSIFLTRKKNKFEEIFKLINDCKIKKSQHPFLSLSITADECRKILIDNIDKSLSDVAKILGRKSEKWASALYKNFNITRDKEFK